MLPLTPWCCRISHTGWCRCHWVSHIHWRKGLPSQPAPVNVVVIFFDNATKILNVWRQVQKAIAFARKSHHGQLRKTGEPYLTHCIHTGNILAALIPSAGKRVLLSPILVHYSGILHNLVTLLLWHTLNSLENIKSHSWPHIHPCFSFYSGMEFGLPFI